MSVRASLVRSTALNLIGWEFRYSFFNTSVRTRALGIQRDGILSLACVVKINVRNRYSGRMHGYVLAEAKSRGFGLGHIDGWAPAGYPWREAWALY
jgi:hypothetical protein